jgi:hypothetical protein
MAGFPDMPASLVADRYVEVFNGKEGRLKSIMECVDRRTFELCSLETGDVLVADADAFERIMAAGSWAVEASKRLFIETENSSDPTFAIDFYAAGKAPGFGPEGVSARPHQKPMVAVYKVQKSKIVKIWTAEDTEGIAGLLSATEEDVCGSDAYAKALDVMIRPGGLTAAPKRYFNDYTKIEVWG